MRLSDARASYDLQDQREFRRVLESELNDAVHRKRQHIEVGPSTYVVLTDANGVRYSVTVSISGSLVLTNLTTNAVISGESVYDVRDYGAVGDGTTNDATAIQSAITAASAAGGGVVWLPAATYGVSTTINLASNVAVMGAPGRTKLYGLGSSNIYLLSANVGGYAAVVADLASDAAVNARSITLTSGTGVSSGDVLLISATHPTSGDVHEWTTLVVGKSGAVLTLADPMPIAVASADTHAISVITPSYRNVTVRDLIFDLGANSGTTTRGMLMAGCVDVVVADCSFEDLGSSSRGGLYLYQCLGVYLSNVKTERCGSIAAAAQQYAACTGIRAVNLRSYDDDGFGILFETGAYNQGMGLSCDRGGDAVYGRGLKFAADLRGQYVNLRSNNSAYTGVMVSNHCVDTAFTNVQTIGNGWQTGNAGLNLDSTAPYSTGIRVRGLLSRGNSSQDIFIGANNSDVIISDADYGTVSNSGTTTYIHSPKTLHAGVAIPAGGVAGTGVLLSTTANFGIFFGSGAPSLSAAKGSIYLRSDGSGTNDRAYVNTDGGTTWTAVVTVA